MGRYTLVMDARQVLGFCSFSVWELAASEMLWNEKGGRLPEVMSRWPGLRARFWRLALSTIEDVFDAKLSLVLLRQG